MKSMNQLINVPQISKQMMEMQREMEKASLIDEMVSDTLQMDVSPADVLSMRCLARLTRTLVACRMRSSTRRQRRRRTR